MEKILEAGVEIIVKNAEGDPDTKATIIHQNSIDYEPKVSVIIPVYNTEEYLRECLDSVINQTLKEIEIICVDDGSTDSSLEILKEYAKQNSRITIITQENLHAGVARNAGLAVAKGDYLYFMDSDDIFDNDEFLQKANDEILKNNSPDAVRYINAIRFDAKTLMPILEKRFKPNEILLNSVGKCLTIKKDFDIISKLSVVPWMGIIKRKYVLNNNLKYINNKVCNDRSFFKESIILAKSVYISDLFCVKHRLNNNKSLINIRKENFECHFKNIDKIISFLKDKNLPENYKQAIIINEFQDMFFFYKKYFDEQGYGKFHLQTIEFLKKRDLLFICPNIKYTENFSLYLKLKKKSLLVERLKMYLLISPNKKVAYKYRDDLSAWYERITGKALNLDNPKTFNEKIQWMKLYDSTPIKTRLADKYLVRDLVKEKIGGKYLISLLGVYDNFNEIDFDKLPNQFVIKCNHGCAYNIIVKDKSQLDKEDARKKINKWMDEDFAFHFGFQLHYSNIPRKIIIEEFIENSGGDLYDYKFWCFNGKVEYIQFLSERNTNGLKMAFYDKEWNKQKFVYSYPLDEKNVEKPKNLDKMIELAEELAEGFNHVRVDFYRLDDGTIYFGEMTFTSASGICRWNDEKINISFGKKIKLPKLAYNIDTGEYYKLPNYKLKTFLESTFSIKNEPIRQQHKIITILGLKFKIKRKQEGGYSFAENFFSVKNKEAKDNKWYKVICILGVKFKFKNKDLTLRKNLMLFNDKIQEQNFKLNTQEAKLKKQDNILEELSNEISVLRQENDTRKKEIIEIANQKDEFKKNITDLKKCSENQRKEIDEMRCKYNGALRRLTPQTTLRSFVYHLADHCNLKCCGCDHFAPLAEEKLVSISVFENDVKRISELTKQELEIIKLMGGEPLLHPDIIQFMQVARNNFPNTRIEIVTNGILLNQQNEAFWNACKEYDITIVPTKYPLNIDYDKAKETAKNYGVKYEYYNKNENILKTSYHIPLDIEGKQNITENFINCFHANWCVMLKEGKLYTCTVAPNIEHFNKYFGYNIPLTEKDGIDIYKAQSIEEILEFLARPIPFCKYCNVKGRTFNHKWNTSKKDISEWT